MGIFPLITILSYLFMTQAAIYDAKASQESWKGDL